VPFYLGWMDDVGNTTQEVASAIELRLVLDRFTALVDEWRLTDAEVDALLYAPPGRWSAVRSLGREWAPHRPCERRVRHVLEIAGHLDRLGRIEEGAAWLRMRRRRADGTSVSMIEVIGGDAAQLDAIRRSLERERAALCGRCRE